LLDQLRRCAQAAGHSATTIETFALWVRHYLVFHAKRHPRELGVTDIGRFLADVAAKDKNPLEALAAARGALDFLYRGVVALGSGGIAVAAGGRGHPNDAAQQRRPRGKSRTPRTYDGGRRLL
jgi:hypothetical protein